MRKLVLPFLCFTLLCNAQESKPKEDDLDVKVTVSKCTHFAVTLPLSELVGEPSTDFTNVTVPKNRGERGRKYSGVGLPGGVDPVLQSENGTRLVKPPLENFDGIDQVAFPPDPSGGAGPNHYIQAVNLKYQIFDKQGKSVLGPFDLNKLWPGKKNSGDPIVMYDEFADRWFISQFQTGTNEVLIAISKTEDPTKEYYTYTFKFDQFPDYLKFSIWPDAYYMTANTSGNNAVAYEREKMLAGDQSAQMVGLKYSPGANGFACPLPSDADGELPPIGTPNYVFNFVDDGWSGQSKDEIRIYKMEIDWTNPNSSTITKHQTLEPEAFDTKFSGTWDDIEQPGTSQKIDAILDVFNYRAQYRKWVEYNTVMLAHTVDVDDSDHGGIRWYELRDDGAGDWKIHQQGTYAPDADSRFIPSVSMDKFGNIGMAYSVSGKSTYPGLRYTGRMKDDPLGKMTVEEGIGVEGKGSQGSGNRYGDYSQLALDPDGITFWYTGEYLGSGGSRKTRIFSFKIYDGTVGVDEQASKMKIEINQIGESILGINVVGLADNDQLVVDLFDIKGNLLIADKTTPVANSFTHNFNIGKLAKGTYLVRFGNKSFQEVQKVLIK